MKRPSILGLFLVIISFQLIASGCAQENTAPVSTLSVEMSEFKFSPASMVVFAGQVLTLNLSNDGGVAHDFSILKKGISAEVPFDLEKHAADILFVQKLGPGESATYQFTLPDVGEYEIICAIPGHMESGMVAKLTAVNP